MSDDVIMHDGKESCEKSLKTNIASDDGRQEKFFSDTLKIAVRNANDLLQPNKGARPDQDDDGKLETSSISDNPSSVITGKDDSNDVVNRYDLNSAPYVETSGSSSQVKATDPSQNEGNQSTAMETMGQRTIALQGKGQPTTAEGKQSILMEKASTGNRKLRFGKDTLSRTNWMMFLTLRGLGFGAACLFSLVTVGVVDSFNGPPNHVVMIGDQAVMPCDTKLDHPIKYYKDGKPIFTGYDIVPDFKDWFRIDNESKGHYNLIIDHAEEKMAGIYTCQQPRVVKYISARLIVVDVKCSTEETNATAIQCTAVINGDVMTKILWEVIHADGITNETGTVVLINSDTIGGIQRQTIVGAPNLTVNNLHKKRVCRVILIFYDAGKSPFILWPAEQMADNVPTYAADIPCMTNAVENWTANTGHVLIAVGSTAIIVAVVAIVIAVFVCKQRRKGHKTIQVLCI